MGRVLAVISLTLALAACGIGAAPVAGGAAELKQAEQAKATEERVRQQLDAAARASEEQRRDAESQGQ
jgi:hypothetical protein